MIKISKITKSFYILMKCKFGKTISKQRAK